jgi:hypothetical protein
VYFLDCIWYLPGRQCQSGSVSGWTDRLEVTIGFCVLACCAVGSIDLFVSW